MNKIIVLVLALGFGGCAEKVVQKCEIPQSLLITPKIDTNRELKSQKDYAILMIDIWGGYQKCVANLESIEKIIKQ